MKIDILTLFPEIFESVFSKSIINRAQKKGLIKIKTHQLRDWATDKHHTTDDTPYGGGVGMVMKVDVIDRALYDLKSQISNLKSQINFKSQNKNSKNNNHLSQLTSHNSRIILLTPQGKTFTQKKAQTLASYSNLLLICGHYEGFDERVRYLVDEQISIGDYILTGGEIPAMVLIDAISRLIPGVLGKNQSSEIETFSMNKFNKNISVISDFHSHLSPLTSHLTLEFPQYTRPFSYKPISKNYKKSLSVPKILLSGNHQKINQWRVEQTVKRSKKIGQSNI